MVAVVGAAIHSKLKFGEGTQCTLGDCNVFKILLLRLLSTALQKIFNKN